VTHGLGYFLGRKAQWRLCVGLESALAKKTNNHPKENCLLRLWLFDGYR
jgi:hypothetical protein